MYINEYKEAPSRFIQGSLVVPVISEDAFKSLVFTASAGGNSDGGL